MILKIRDFFIKNNKNLGIWGWWQGKNLGDIWIKQSMIKAFEGASFIDTETPRKYFNQYGFIICGGGGLFIRDVHESWKENIPVPFGVLGLGAEFKHKTTKACELSRTAEFFFVRDKYSVECMLLNPDSRSYDMTLFDPMPALKEFNRDNVLLIWRDPDELLRYKDFQEYIGLTTDIRAWQKTIQDRFKRLSIDDFNTEYNYIEELTSHVGFVISARYHGIIAAIQRGVPCIGIDLCPKTRALLNECGLSDFCLKLGEIDKLKDKIVQCFDEAKEIRQKQLLFVENARTKLEQDVSIARERINACQGRRERPKK